ncbi:MAG: UDP-N-acetylmuramate--L-alanine ligase [Nitrospirae bacterium]|nr:UDP-N-acetylmuramate--L-alanine ligase [Nitrospirota bacterium]
MFERYKVIHFVGIGGIGMSGIAEVLHNLGYEVTGSDIRETETTNRLIALGIKIYIGHNADNIDDAHVVVISSAVPEENPEVVEAKRRSIPVIRRAEMLAELARLKYSILVAGAHGKTTTTSLISAILAHAGFDPTVIIGGKLKATGSNARLGQGEFLVAEADESDGSFLKLSPTIAIATNIDREHMDFFKTMEAMKEAFISFLNKIPFYGVSIVCMENEYLRELLTSLHRRYITYGFGSESEIYARNIQKGFMSINFEVVYKGKVMGRFNLPLVGEHNVLNCLAAIGVALELQIDLMSIKEALKNFGGIQRRFEFKGEAKGIKIFDDYGHHPTEIKAILKAAKEGLFNNGDNRLFVLFQPHRYTRTKDLLYEFSSSFKDADTLILLDIYAAGEKPIEGINSAVLFERIKKSGHCKAVYISDKEEVIRHIISQIRKGDMLLTLGAGDVWKLGEEILQRLNTQQTREI